MLNPFLLHDLAGHKRLILKMDNGDEMYPTATLGSEKNRDTGMLLPKHQRLVVWGVALTHLLLSRHRPPHEAYLPWGETLPQQPVRLA